jgi:molybdate transport system substrate-binding protein
MRLLLCLFLLLAPALAPGLARAQQTPPLQASVFAAASLTDVLGDVGKLWQQQGHPAPRLVFAASSTLAHQIEQGAPANIFASADEQWMNYLEKGGHIVAGTRHDLLGNDLVLIEPTASLKQVTIAKGFDIAAILGPNGRLATGDPAHVPVGLYAKQALTWLGVWDSVKDHIAGTEDVRGALLLVSRGEAPVGIVYATDAAVSPGVGIAGVFPADSHPPVTYPFALVKGGDTDEAKALLAFFASPAATAVFRKAGFSVK